MRSARSPARSRSFETLFEVSAKRRLASPTVFNIEPPSRAGRLGLPSERGIGTPSTVLRLIRFFRMTPPVTPAAAAPTAIAGPFALTAACLAVPTAWPIRFVTARLVELRFEFDPELEPERRFGAPEPGFDLVALPLELDLRWALAVAGFDRDEAFVERLEPERLEPLFALAVEPLDDPLLARLRGLLGADLLFAILIPLLGRERFPAGCTRFCRA